MNSLTRSARARTQSLTTCTRSCQRLRCGTGPPCCKLSLQFKQL